MGGISQPNYNLAAGTMNKFRAFDLSIAVLSALLFSGAIYCFWTQKFEAGRLLCSIFLAFLGLLLLNSYFNPVTYLLRLLRNAIFFGTYPRAEINIALVGAACTLIGLYGIARYFIF